MFAKLRAVLCRFSAWLETWGLLLGVTGMDPTHVILLVFAVLVVVENVWHQSQD